MKTVSFHYDLPEELIAQYPPEKRGGSRLLVFDRKTGALTDSATANITDYIDDNTHVVFNNSKVRKARIFGTSTHGGIVEFLLLQQIDDVQWRVIASKVKKQKVGKTFTFSDGIKAEISGIDDNLRILKFSEPVSDVYLDTHGHIPLPPYIKRDDKKMDSERYQTVYADQSGSAAAPTAGLHFTDDLLQKIKNQASAVSFVTLHVGMGTFSPIRVKTLEEHKMHTEEYEISPETAELLNKSKAEGKKILAVGTTSVRTLESACREGIIENGKQSTDLFIYPGYKFKFVDKMFTNFHTPDSSLIVMVSAFAGQDEIKRAYTHAVENKYRFFSYGDAMLIL